MGLTLLRMVPFWIWPLLLVGAWGFYGNYKSNRLEKERAAANVESQRLAAKAGQIKREESRQVEIAYAQKLKAAKITADKLRASESGLRDQLTSNPDRDAVAVCGVDGERGRTLEVLLAESAELAREGAEEVIRLGAKTAALQDYVQRVCVGTKDADNKN